MKIQFQNLSHRDWFIREGEVCQRVFPLNGSNTYNFTRGEWQHTPPTTKISRTVPPSHLAPTVSEVGDCGKTRVLFWNPQGFYQTCRREQLNPGERYIPLTALPQFPVIVEEFESYQVERDEL